MTDDSSAIVVGAGNPVGRRVAERFAADEGFELVAGLDDTDSVHDVSDADGTFRSYRVDLNDYDRIDDVVAEVDETAPVEALVSAAISGGYYWIDELESAEWDRVLDYNLKSQYTIARAVGPRMYERKRGYVVMDSSIAGRIGSTSGGVHYSAAKAGTFGLTRGLAKQLSPHVNVNCVVHGLVDIPTVSDEAAREDRWDDRALEKYRELLPLGRLADPDDIAKVMETLCSDRASYMTGSIVTVDGGLDIVPSKAFLTEGEFR